MRKKLIAGNWKMYKTHEEATAFIEEAVLKCPPNEQMDVVICPPSLYLTELVKRSAQSSIAIGAQTMHEAAEGAFTGEISPKMLADTGVQYVILGHSERRQYFNETDNKVNEKVHAAFAYNLLPIVCVGETLDEREQNKTAEVVSAQVEKAFAAVSADDAEKAVIAYEPIWAIGTGKTATAEDANDVCAQIRKTINKLYNKKTADAVRILYGGSVKPSNIEELMSENDIDGALVGGASLEADSFLQLLEVKVNG